MNKSLIKRSIVSMGISMLILITFAIPVYAAVNVSISTVEIGGTTSANNSEVVTTSINVTNAVTVGAITVYLEYDPSVIYATKIQEGVIYTAAAANADQKQYTTTIDNSTGNVTVSLNARNSTINNGTLNGTGSIADITFQVIGSAGSSSRLNFSFVEISDGDSLPYDILLKEGNYTTVNDTFTVLSPPYVPPVPVPALSSIGQVVLAILLLLILMRVGIKYKR